MVVGLQIFLHDGQLTLQDLTSGVARLWLILLVCLDHQILPLIRQEYHIGTIELGEVFFGALARIIRDEACH